MKYRNSPLFDDCFMRNGPDECWPWTALVDKCGYGRFWDKEEQKVVGAHRYAYKRVNGAIPKRHQVCHKCDNPPCVNPAHLFLGSFKDNMNDMRAKGRHRVPIAPNNQGSKHGMAKFVETDIIDILNLRAGGMLIQDIADLYGRSDGLITGILNGKTWKHVTATYPLLLEECREQSRRYRERLRAGRPRS